MRDHTEFAAFLERFTKACVLAHLSTNIVIFSVVIPNIGQGQITSSCGSNYASCTQPALFCCNDIMTTWIVFAGCQFSKMWGDSQYFFMFCSLALIWSFIHANTLDLESCHFISPLDFGGIYVCNLLRLPTLPWYTTLITGKLWIPCCISLVLYICLHLINTLWWYLQTASQQQLCTTILFVLLVLLVHLDIKQEIDFKLHQHQVLVIRYLQKTTEKLLITTSCWWWHLPRNVELDTGRMISPQITWCRRESHTTWTIHTLKWIECGYNELTWILQGTLFVHWEHYERRREVCG